MITAIIQLRTKEIHSQPAIYACGRCFQQVTNRDKFCSHCGSEFVTDALISTEYPKIVISYEELQKINEVKI